MIALLGLLLLQQGRGPEVMLAVDRDRVVPGDVITFTIRVASGLQDPIKVDLPALNGFEIESRSERTDVSAGTGGGRITWIELQLRAVSPGEWRLGPVNVRQGIAYARGDAIVVSIEGGGPPPVTAGLSARLARIIQRAPPPGALADAGISVALSDEDVSVGEQVDVVTIAWFEREVRQRLRRAPTVEAPQIEGVWSYPQAGPSGIAASRQVGGRWYDLFVMHHVAFPLTPGRFAVAPAKLIYSVPVAYQFFSQEERYELASESMRFTARPLPDGPRAPGFNGAVGHGLVLGRRLTPVAGRQGEAFSAEVTVRGEGNVALWPEPDLRWPEGLRVYPEASEERPLPIEGRFGGTKTFRYLVIPDSSGQLTLPPVAYPYYDPTSRSYPTAALPALTLIVAPRGERVVARAEPPPMRLDLRVPMAHRVRSLLPAWGWWLLVMAPVLGWLVPRIPRRRRREAPAAVTPDTLAQLERRLASALREMGARGEDGGALAALKARVDAARFAPGAVGDRRALLAEVEAALGATARAGREDGARWRRRAGLVLTLAVLRLQAVEAQSGPEQLYEAGAYRAAANGFLRRAVLAPNVTTHWFNLGDAAYRGGQDAVALTAYVRAARLSPRDGGVRRALVLVPAADGRAAATLWVAPVTPEELWLIGLVSWLAGWTGILLTRSWRGRWVVLLGGGLACFALAAGLRWRYAQPVGVLVSNQQARLSPHELAPAIGEASALSTVRLGEARGAWVWVTLAGGQSGWLERQAVVALADPRVP